MASVVWSSTSSSMNLRFLFAWPHRCPSLGWYRDNWNDLDQVMTVGSATRTSIPKNDLPATTTDHKTGIRSGSREVRPRSFVDGLTRSPGRRNEEIERSQFQRWCQCAHGPLRGNEDWKLANVFPPMVRTRSVPVEKWPRFSGTSLRALITVFITRQEGITLWPDGHRLRQCRPIPGSALSMLTSTPGPCSTWSILAIGPLQYVGPSLRRRPTLAKPGNKPTPTSAGMLKSPMTRSKLPVSACSRRSLSWRSSTGCGQDQKADRRAGSSGCWTNPGPCISSLATWIPSAIRDAGWLIGSRVMMLKIPVDGEELSGPSQSFTGCVHRICGRLR